MIFDDFFENSPLRNSLFIHIYTYIYNIYIYSNENFEDRSGEGFHVNSSWTWVGAPAAGGCLSRVALVEPSLRAAAQGAVASPAFVLPHRGPAGPAAL
jgi:hypothetical protein